MSVLKFAIATVSLVAVPAVAGEPQAEEHRSEYAQRLESLCFSGYHLIDLHDMWNEVGLDPATIDYDLTAHGRGTNEIRQSFRRDFCEFDPGQSPQFH